MVKIGTSGDQFSSSPKPKMYPDQIGSSPTEGSIMRGPFTETDSVGKGYLDSTPIQLPTDEIGITNENGTAGVVNTTPKVYEGILPRRNTPSGPSEQAGKVMFDMINGVYVPRIQFTPSAVTP